MMTITEALVKLKLTSKKIDDGMSKILIGFTTSQAKAAPPGGFRSVEDFKNEVKSRLDSIAGLIEYRNNLKRAIVESNAKTFVTVGKQQMTVANAIERKQSIAYDKKLLTFLENGWSQMTNAVNTHNAQLNNKADEFVAKSFGGDLTPEDKIRARTQWLDANQMRFVTHDCVEKVIEKLRSDIDDFESNVDVALSVSNATTKIDV